MQTPREWYIKVVAERGLAKGRFVHVTKDEQGRLVAKPVGQRIPFWKRIFRV